MYSITVNQNKIYKTNLQKSGDLIEGTINDKIFSANWIKINEYQFHFIFENQSYHIDVIKINSEEKSLLLKINGLRYHLQLKDKYDELLHNLGLDKVNSKKVNDIKAPMPGMVLKILVSEGDTVKKGDAILILEAMKMENILKSPSDGVIKKIAINKGVAVEKNQILIQF